ncbi:MAG: hypothetical protein LC637_13670 [Xanthomonadaceae bacterium]|nr:hypothetical protein [Xanthomonadaceae bacterium]
MSRPDNRSLDFPAGKQAGKQAVHNAMRLDIEALIGPAAGALTQHGWYVQENAVPKALVALLRADFARLLNQDRLKRAGIGRERTFQLARQIRRDWIFWLSRSRNAHRVLLDQLECLRPRVDRASVSAWFRLNGNVGEVLDPPR